MLAAAEYQGLVCPLLPGVKPEHLQVLTLKPSAYRAHDKELELFPQAWNNKAKRMFSNVLHLNVIYTTNVLGFLVAGIIQQFKPLLVYP